jgi:hypothetical protein
VHTSGDGNTENPLPTTEAVTDTSDRSSDGVIASPTDITDDHDIPVTVNSNNDNNNTDTMVVATPDVTVDTSVMFAIQKIVKQKHVGVNKQFLVRWMDSPDGVKYEDTWVKPNDVTQGAKDNFYLYHTLEGKRRKRRYRINSFHSLDTRDCSLMSS